MIRIDSWACSISGSKLKTPTLPKSGTIGHPKKPNQSLGVDVRQRFHPKMRLRQNKKRRVAQPLLCGLAGAPVFGFLKAGVLALIFDFRGSWIDAAQWSAARPDS